MRHGGSQAAIDAMFHNRTRRTLGSMINPHNYQDQYLTDWDLGSVILSQSRALGFEEREVITEITERHAEFRIRQDREFVGDFERATAKVIASKTDKP